MRSKDTNIAYKLDFCVGNSHFYRADHCGQIAMFRKYKIYSN